MAVKRHLWVFLLLPSTALGSLLDSTFEEQLSAPFPVFQRAARIDFQNQSTPGDAQDQRPLVPADLWGSLAPFDARYDPLAKWLSERIPGLDAKNLRELPFEKADVLFMDAFRRHLFGIDLFSDSGWRTPKLFYISQKTLIALYSKYDLESLNMATGKTVDGQDFHTQGAVVGAGRLELLYNLDQFKFGNPVYPDYTYISKDRVTYTIKAPGDILLNGISVDSLFDTRIMRFYKVPKIGLIRIVIKINLLVRNIEKVISRPLNPIRIISQ